MPANRHVLDDFEGRADVEERHDAECFGCGCCNASGNSRDLGSGYHRWRTDLRSAPSEIRTTFLARESTIDHEWKTVCDIVADYRKGNVRIIFTNSKGELDRNLNATCPF